MNTIKTKTINLEGTQATKISSIGFGKKRNCIEYLGSTSLSPLNEKFFAMLYNEIVFNGKRDFTLKAGLNGFNFSVLKFSRNKTTTNLFISVEAFNAYKPEFFEQFFDKHAFLSVTYKNGKNRAKITPEKDKGKIKEFNYFGNYYPLADFVVLSNGKKAVKRWYYSSYDFSLSI